MAWQNPSTYVRPPLLERWTSILKVPTSWQVRYTVFGSIASIHWRSSPGIRATAGFGGVKLSPRSVECVPVTPGTKVRLVRGRFGMRVVGSAPLTAISASPPPGARPRCSGVPTLLAHPPFVRLKMPQLSGWPSYLKGSVLLLLGAPSTFLDQRHRSTPPGTPRMETT